MTISFIKRSSGAYKCPPNKALSAAALLLSMVTSTAALAANGPDNNGRSDYDIDDDGLIEINDLADLNEIRNHLDGTTLYGNNTGCSEGGTGVCNGFELTADLDFDTNADGVMTENDTYWNDGSGWQPIGNSGSNKFIGIFDGNNYEINNLYINRPSSDFVGLFGYVLGGTLKNTGLAGSLLSVTGKNSVGPLAGFIGNTDSTVTNSYATGLVKGVTFVGGLLGEVGSATTISYSYSTGTVQASGHSVGGLAGSSDLEVTLSNSYSTASILGDHNVGGLIGRVQLLSTISNNFSTGSVQGVYQVGGLLGQVAGINTIHSNFSTGLVTADTDVGGLIGDTQNGDDTVSNMYWAVDTTTQATSVESSDANSYVGMSIAEMQCATASDASCAAGITIFNGWDAAIWDFGTLNELPGLIINGVLHRDADGDSLLDTVDAFPLAHIGSLTDTDGDGAPDECDTTCLAKGMTADLDDDNDGTPDSEDGAPLDPTGTVDSDGDGTSDVSDIDTDNNGLIEISSLADLNEIRNNLDGSSFNGLNGGCLNDLCNGFELTTDLDFDTNNDGIMDANDDYWNNGEGWLRIGEHDGDGAFSAILDGNGHVIKNLYMNPSDAGGESDARYYIGLFGVIDGATIRHLGLSGGLMSISADSYVGALAGSAENSTISHSYNTGSIQGAGYNVGGLVGYADASTISDSYNTGPVLGGEEYIGGLIGEADANNQIINSYNLGSVHGAEYVGGLMGYSDSSNSIRTSFNTGSVSGVDGMGGLVGSVYETTEIIASFNSGKVQGSSELGGLVGYVENAGLVINTSFNTGIVNVLVNGKGSDIGGLVGFAGNVVTNFHSHWATDNSGQTTTNSNENETSIEGGLTLANLKCAIQANTTDSNSDCGAGDFYTAWDDAARNNVWDFGNNQQLPGLIINTEIYRDSDGDNSLDRNDAFPQIHIGNLTDTDGDGAPDECDADCINSGMSADTDDDNDGTLDINDGAPLDPAGTVDSDNDGISDTSDIDGDNDGLIEINSLADLDEIRNNLDGSAFYGSSDGCAEGGCNGFELTTDLDFDTNQDELMDENDAYWNAGEGWVPLGEYTNDFTATFEGNDHVIRNLYINRPSTSRVGLFGSIMGESDEVRAQIRKLGLSGSLMSVTGQSYLGALAGYAENITISQSYNTGSVHSAGNGQNVGGLIGRGRNFITIMDSHNAGAVLGTSSNVGGLLGYGQFDIQIINSYNLGTIQGDRTVGGLVGALDEERHVIDASYNIGSIQATSTSSSNAGGLVGYVWQYAHITASFNTGSIQGVNYVGGLVGKMEELNQVDSSFNTGSITGTGSHVGGLMGRLWRNNVISSSFSSGAVNGVSDLGGLIGSISGTTIDVIENNYWATDSTGQATSTVEKDVTSTQGGLTLANLQCAIQANTTDTNSNCAAGAFYTAWDHADLNGVWDFGTSQQLPGLILNGVNYRDSDGNGALDDFDADGQADVHDSDDDNDGVLDVNDAFPFIALNSIDTDQDGIPDECDDACETSGMSSDSDDDNDGVLDTVDGFPLISIGELTDTDNDGRPNDCDQECIDSGMVADTDDDNDGVLDTVDGFPLIAIGELTDTDNDGRPNDCDQACIELGMTADIDDDNDGISDTLDGFPLISIGDLTDTDHDGRPNTCDQACIELGMVADTDNDNDGVLDTVDGFPLISIGELTDTDNDGRPNDCDQECIDSGMVADTDDDNDGILDTVDGFPLIAIGELTDTDNDGRPNDCDQECIDSGMVADTDDDNDGVLDAEDAFPLDASESNDADNDGVGDIADLDDDNDGVLDVDDEDNSADNGVPTLNSVPDDMFLSVDSIDSTIATIVWSEAFYDLFRAFDEVDAYDLTFIASLNGEVLTPNGAGVISLPAGRLEIVWTAQDAAGNTSNAISQIVNVFPWVRFSLSESIMGDNSTANIVVELSGESPIYPVVIELAANLESSDTTVDQDDFWAETNDGFNLVSPQQIIIQRGDGEEANTQASLTIVTTQNDASEYNESLMLELTAIQAQGSAAEDENFFALDVQNAQHLLTISYENLAPQIQLVIEQDGQQVTSIQQGGGEVVISAMVTDGNSGDSHTFTWDVLSLNIDAPLGSVLTLDPSALIAGHYMIEVTTTDSGENSLTAIDEMEITVIEPVVQPSNGGSSGGSLWWMILALAGLSIRKRIAY